MTKAVHLNNPAPINYPIKKTGYYCVLTEGFNIQKYSAVVEFRNAYGELPATQIPKLPFYGGMSILYALVAVFWGFLYFQHRHDIRGCQSTVLSLSSTDDVLCSCCAKLHHGHSHLFDSRNDFDMGILW